MTLLEAIAQLRSMKEKYEYDHRGSGPDFFEVGHFLEWVEQRELLRISIQENPPASTVNTGSDQTLK